MLIAHFSVSPVVIITFPVITEVSMVDLNLYKVKQVYFTDILNI